MGLRKTPRSSATRLHPRGASKRSGKAVSGGRKVWGITRSMLEGILEIAKEKYPMEFLATLTHKDGVIFEINMIPGTIEGDHFSVLQTHMQPPDLKFRVCGTVHSHPSQYPIPSRADIIFFGKQGNTHIIVAHPYSMRSWRAYDNMGKPIELEVVD